MKTFFLILLIKNIFARTPNKTLFGQHQTVLINGISKYENINTLSDIGSFIYPKWSCPIPYKFGNVIDTTRIITAFDYIENKTGWTFIERTTENDYIEFIDDNGCWSYLGKRGGMQEIGLSIYCDQGAVVHEIAHAIGLHHEQTRRDRDNYVLINFDNIPIKAVHNFEIVNAYNRGNYDYGSIMHYGKWDFAINSSIKTIIPIGNTDGFCYIGQRFELSEYDVLHMKNLFDGESCKVTENTCLLNSVKLCGVDSEVNGFDIIFGEYNLIGTQNQKNKYKSRWKYLNNNFILYWNNTNWIIDYTGYYFAISKSDNLLSTKWYQYSFSKSEYELDNSMQFTEVLCETPLLTPLPTSSPNPTSSPTTLPTLNLTPSKSNKSTSISIFYGIILFFIIFF